MTYNVVAWVRYKKVFASNWPFAAQLALAIADNGRVYTVRLTAILPRYAVVVSAHQLEYICKFMMNALWRVRVKETGNSVTRNSGVAVRH